MKLIKEFFDGFNHFYLKNENGDTIGTTKFPFSQEMILLAKSKNIELSRLCHENCEAIEKGYDLKEIVNNHLKEWEFEQLLGSLKDKKEWNVYIETEPMNIDEIREKGKGFLNTNINKSKLDLNGCLILKVKKDEQNQNN
jgi:hypothetical protein